MAIISLKLDDREFIHVIGTRYNSRELMFNAETDSWKGINVVGLGGINKGSVIIYEDEKPEELGRITFVPSFNDPNSDEVIRECFQIEIRIPPSTFQTLLTYDEKLLNFQLIFTSSAKTEKLTHGWGNDDIDWKLDDTSKQEFELAEGFRVILSQKKEDV